MGDTLKNHACAVLEAMRRPVAPIKMLRRNGAAMADFCIGSRADLATRLLIPTILVRTSLDSRHDGDRREELRLVPIPVASICSK